MQIRQRYRPVTVADYLAKERAPESVIRHEYLDGNVLAMAGESLEHSTICTNLIYLVVGQLRGKPCRALSPNMKVRTTPTGLYSYPDLTVVCGEPIFHDEHRDIVVNPTVIVEVLSPSTEAFDRGTKWIRYQQITTLSDYLLIAQERPLIEHFVRQADGHWLYSITEDLTQSVEIASIDCHLPLAEIYERIVFAGEETAPT
ncbi:MAG: Uma2 family endonuclease [Candidatus Competibacteraceae bacterium]